MISHAPVGPELLDVFGSLPCMFPEIDHHPMRRSTGDPRSGPVGGEVPICCDLGIRSRDRWVRCASRLARPEYLWTATSCS